MRQITWRDYLATGFVAAAAALYLVWVNDGGFTSMSTREVAGTVFVLGIAGCIANQGQMASVYGAAGQHHAPMGYLVATSVAGAVALVAGVAAVITANDMLLAVLVAAVVTVWLLSTARHLLTAKPNGAEDKTLHPVR
jgi:hypothetical protein